MESQASAEPGTAPQVTGHDKAAPTAAPVGVARQAYVLIHGMGEQIPMDTIKGFAKTVWSLDTDVQVPNMPHAEETWSRPDNRTGSLELRRITTRKSRTSASFAKGVRTDFYELYWADLTAGSTWQQFTAWVRYLLFRPWSKVPVNVRAAWLCLWAGTVLVAALAAIPLVPRPIWEAHAPHWLSQGLVGAAAAALLTFIHRQASATFGRVVKYTRSRPDNIAARQAVRERGLALLAALHAENDPGKAYDRVVIVSHSLGTILAHDLLAYFWAKQVGAQSFEPESEKGRAVAALEAAAAALHNTPLDDAALAAFRAAQADLGLLLRKQSLGAKPEGRWLISDLVTIGSPLSHAEFLLADGPEDLAKRCEGRELPTCPPFREELDPQLVSAAMSAGLLPEGESRLISYRYAQAPDKWALNFAAPFAAVRWTNVFDPARFVAQGDMISGPLVQNFGPGIVDRDISVGNNRSRRFTHTLYWNAKQNEVRLKIIRRSINLLDL